MRNSFQSSLLHNITIAFSKPFIEVFVDAVRFLLKFCVTWTVKPCVLNLIPSCSNFYR